MFCAASSDIYRILFFSIGLVGIVNFFRYELKLCIALGLERTVEAGLVSDVTLALVHPYLQYQAILVAVGQDLFDFLHMAAFFAFSPQFLPAPAEIYSISGFYGQIQGLSVHVGYHKHLAGFGVLGNRGYEAVAVKFWAELEALFRFFTFSHFFYSPNQAKPEPKGRA